MQTFPVPEFRHTSLLEFRPQCLEQRLRLRNDEFIRIARVKWLVLIHLVAGQVGISLFLDFAMMNPKRGSLSFLTY